MSARAHDRVVVTEGVKGRRYLSSTHTVGEKLIISGSVFFDHVNGLRAVKSAPKGYALIEYWYDFDWMQQHAVLVTPFTDVNELIEKATKKVADARSAGVSGNMDLTEVYGIIVD